jgi:ketosteroid isomerase-like protein
MPRENVEVVQRILDEWGKGNLGAAVEHFDPHIVWVVAEEFPESGVLLGLDGVADYMRHFLAQWDHYAIRGKALREVGDTVLADVVQYGKGKTSGAVSETPSFFLFTFRGGKIVRMDIVIDERDALAAAGLQP